MYHLRSNLVFKYLFQKKQIFIGDQLCEFTKKISKASNVDRKSLDEQKPEFFDDTYSDSKEITNERQRKEYNNQKYEDEMGEDSNESQESPYKKPVKSSGKKKNFVIKKNNLPNSIHVAVNSAVGSPPRNSDTSSPLDRVTKNIDYDAPCSNKVGKGSVDSNNGKFMNNFNLDVIPTLNEFLGIFFNLFI